MRPLTAVEYVTQSRITSISVFQRIGSGALTPVQVDGRHLITPAIYLPTPSRGWPWAVRLQTGGSTHTVNRWINLGKIDTVIDGALACVTDGPDAVTDRPDVDDTLTAQQYAAAKRQ